MKASELMIGDWVMNDSGFSAKEPIRICPEMFVIAKADGAYARDIIDVEPIPITPEILEKNGFEKEGSWFIIEDDYYDVSIKEITDSIWRVRYCNTEISAFDSILHIAFIHELQHAFRLCGIKKEIVL